MNGVQGPVHTGSCSQDKLNYKQVLKKLCEKQSQGQGATRKRRRTRIQRSMRISPYTAIVKLGSTSGQISFDIMIMLNRAESSTQEQQGLSISSRVFMDTRGCEGQGRGPWKPAWPPPVINTEEH